VKVLLVTMYFPPAGGAGVHRPLKLARHLSELGLDVHVLAPELGLDPVLLGRPVLPDHDALAHDELLRHHEPLLEDGDRDRAVRQVQHLAGVAVRGRLALHVGVLDRAVGQLLDVLRLDPLLRPHGAELVLLGADPELLLVANDLGAVAGGGAARGLARGRIDVGLTVRRAHRPPARVVAMAPGRVETISASTRLW
jgi:hypothetical protein